MVNGNEVAGSGSPNNVNSGSPTLVTVGDLAAPMLAHSVVFRERPGHGTETVLHCRHCHPHVSFNTVDSLKSRSKPNHRRRYSRVRRPPRGDSRLPIAGDASLVDASCSTSTHSRWRASIHRSNSESRRQREAFDVTLGEHPVDLIVQLI